MNKTNKLSKTSIFFGKLRKKLTHSHEKNSNVPESLNISDTGVLSEPPLAPYYSPDVTNVLFLSKRGLSRAPLAREVMRKVLHSSDHFGSIRPSARGISDAYEFCPFDKRMVQAAQKSGYDLAGSSRRVNMGELSSANLIITLDQESEQYVKSRTFYIRGQVRQIGMFLPAGNSPYIADPFERDELTDSNSNYEQIIRSVEFGCEKLLKYLP
ncbi:MAG: hypothetical protein VW576_08170, partial [Opitutae bacterium]